MNERTSAQISWLDVVVGAIGGTATAGLGWALYETIALSHQVHLAMGSGMLATSGAAGLAALVALPIAVACGALWRAERLGGRLRRFASANPPWFAALVTSVLAGFLAVSYATFFEQRLFYGLFASVMVQRIAVAATVPVWALVCAGAVRLALPRLEGVFEGMLGGRLAGVVSVAAVGTLAIWAASFMVLAPHVWEQLAFAQFAPFLVIPAGGALGAMFVRGRAPRIASGVAAVGLVGLSGAFVVAQPSKQVDLAIESGQSGTGFILGMLSHSANAAPVDVTAEGKSGICAPGERAPTAADVGKAKPNAPDIILLTVDAMRWDHTPMSGYRRHTMPHFAAHARHGTVFTRAYSPAASTRQTFRSLFSGLYPSRVDAPKSTRWGTSFDTDQVTLASYMKAAGYHTIALSSDPKAFPKKYHALQGFQVKDESPSKVRRKLHHSAPYKVDRIISYLSDLHEKKPQFIWTHLLEAHQPYHIGPDPKRYGHKKLDRYDSALHFVDGEINRLLNFAQSPDRRRKTIVIITADHGQAFHDHGFNILHGMTVYQEETHVPLVVWGPHIKAQRVSQPVSLLDVLPTVLDLAGLKVPTGLCGQSLVPTLEKKSPPPTQPIYVEAIPDRTRDYFMAAYIDGDNKFVIHPDSGVVEWFNTAKDPDERHNLGEKFPDKLKTYVATIRKFYKAHGLDPKRYGL